jgi:hypothetical protein
MSTAWISARLRALVQERAGKRCEYCGIHQADSFLGCQVDHIVSEKHGGATTEENLALACTVCNRAKGTDIAGIDDFGGIAPLFHPRLDRWAEHFRREGRKIVGLTPKGRVTARLLRFNAPEQLEERGWM